MCSAPEEGHNCAGGGHRSAGNSAPVFWQTPAPPKAKLLLFNQMFLCPDAKPIKLAQVLIILIS